MKSFFSNFHRHLATFDWSHCYWAVSLILSLVRLGFLLFRNRNAFFRDSESPPAWPDWATFRRSWWQIFYQEKPKYLNTLWAILKNVTIRVKPDADTFGQFLEKIGLLFIPSSSHAVRRCFLALQLWEKWGFVFTVYSYLGRHLWPIL